MKSPFCFFLLLLLASSASGQTFDEWFRQQHTKEKYLVQQIAALQAYSGTLRQGYALARDGMRTVRHIKNGDLGLHQVFFSSLAQVNPAIRDVHLVHDILRMQAAICRLLETKQFLFNHPRFSAAEQAYLRQIRGSLLQTAARDLDKLLLLLTNGGLVMPDDSRLRHLATLHRQVLETYRFTRSFLEEAQQRARQRAYEHLDLENTRTILKPLNP